VDRSRRLDFGNNVDDLGLATPSHGSAKSCETKTQYDRRFGVTQRHSFIFSAVSHSPQREVFFSGRFVNAQCAAISFLRAGKISSRIPGSGSSGTASRFSSDSRRPEKGKFSPFRFSKLEA
jgi:hypothetical protein